MARSSGAFHASGTAQRLQQTLVNMKPLRLLFAGHADAMIDGQRTLAFADDVGGLSLAQPNALASMLQSVRQANRIQHRHPGVLELVFLNG